jgi:putative membrane protein
MMQPAGYCRSHPRQVGQRAFRADGLFSVKSACGTAAPFPTGIRTGASDVTLLVRWLSVAAALVVAVWSVPGITIGDGSATVAVLVMAAVFGLVNAFLRPLLQILSCPLVLMTLGLFTLVVNTVCFSLSSWIAQRWFGAQFIVDGFWPALVGSIVGSAGSWPSSAIGAGPTRSTEFKETGSLCSAMFLAPSCSR